MQSPDVGERGLGQQRRVERLPLGSTRIRRYAGQVSVGEHALGQGREGDAPDAGVAEHVEQVGLDPPVEHRVGRLVNQQGSAQLAQDLDRLSGARTGVAGDTGIQGLALTHRAVQRAHGLLQRSVGVEAVAVEDVDVVDPHPLQRLIQRGQEVFAGAAALPVGPGPHVVAGFGRQDQLVPVGPQIAPEDRAKVALGAAVGRPVVVGQVEVRDTQVEGSAQDRLLALQRDVVTKVVPQAQRDRRQDEAAAATAAHRHPVVAIAGGSVLIGAVGHADMLAGPGGPHGEPSLSQNAAPVYPSN
ncbi:MAG: hypothetical protein BWY91_02983 [bacterium ADurb.BinA028]|nr:MAG: hypothetical protein BWY91_02983 [bacterium ADurb.BinA028]